MQIRECVKRLIRSGFEKLKRNRESSHAFKSERYIIRFDSENKAVDVPRRKRVTVVEADLYRPDTVDIVSLCSSYSLCVGTNKKYQKVIGSLVDVVVLSRRLTVKRDSAWPTAR